MTGIVLTTLGMVLKIFINTSFYLVIGGQVLAAIGQPFITNASAKVSAVWFGANERVLSLSAAVASQAFGVAFGFVVPSIFVRDEDTNEEFKTHIMLSLIVQAALGAVLCLACWALF